MTISRKLASSALLAHLGILAIACDEAEDVSRIAIAGGSLTEIVYLLGLEDNIVGTDTTSLYPPSAQDFPSIGYVRALSTEGILSIQPSLLLSEDDAGPPHVMDQLKKLEVTIRTISETQTAAGIMDKLACVAQVLGASNEKQAAISRSLEQQISRISSARAKLQGVRAAMIFGINDGVPTVAGTGTSGHSLLEIIGVENAFGEISGWKPVSLESMVEFNPQFLIIPQRALDISGGEEIVVKNKSIQMTEAGKKQQLIVHDTMALLGFGPRTLTAAAEVAEQIVSKLTDDNTDTALIEDI